MLDNPELPNILVAHNQLCPQEILPAQLLCVMPSTPKAHQTHPSRSELAYETRPLQREESQGIVMEVVNQTVNNDCLDVRR